MSAQGRWFPALLVTLALCAPRARAQDGGAQPVVGSPELKDARISNPMPGVTVTTGWNGLGRLIINITNDLDAPILCTVRGWRRREEVRVNTGSWYQTQRLAPEVEEDPKSRIVLCWPAPPPRAWRTCLKTVARVRMVRRWVLDSTDGTGKWKTAPETQNVCVKLGPWLAEAAR